MFYIHILKLNKMIMLLHFSDWKIKKAKLCLLSLLSVSLSDVKEFLFFLREFLYLILPQSVLIVLQCFCFVLMWNQLF